MKKIDLEKDRAEKRAKAAEDWENLTKGDWPESEHEQRFEALTRLVLTAPRKKKR